MMPRHHFLKIVCLVTSVLIVAQAGQSSLSPSEREVQKLRAEELARPTARLKKNLALQYYLLRQGKLFRLKMQEAHELDSSDWEPAYYLGRYALTERENAEEALSYFTLALLRSPAQPKVLAARGEALEKAGRLDEARTAYQLASANSSTSRPAMLGLARLALLAERYDEAIGRAQRALEADAARDALSAEAHLLQGKAYVALARWPEAAKSLEAAANSDPSDARALFQLRKVYQQLGEPQKAADSLERWKERMELLGRRVLE